MDRKKVAVLLPWLKMGGTNKIALNFMRELAQYCDVTLILSENSGELLPELPDNIHLIIDKMDNFRYMVKHDFMPFRIGALLQDCLYYAKVKSGKDGVDNYKYIVDRHDYVSEDEYDCAVSYHGQSPERLLNLLYRIHAHKKVVWIHGEMSFPQKIINELKKYYLKVDHFFFVSTSTMKSFAEKYPFVNNRSTVYYNPIDRQEIIVKSEKNCSTSFFCLFTNLINVYLFSK